MKFEKFWQLFIRIQSACTCIQIKTFFFQWSFLNVWLLIILLQHFFQWIRYCYLDIYFSHYQLVFWMLCISILYNVKFTFSNISFDERFTISCFMDIITMKLIDNTVILFLIMLYIWEHRASNKMKFKFGYRTSMII